MNNAHNATESKMEKLFTIAGTSVLNNALTYRFATGKIGVRTSVLKQNGHTDIKLQELPNPMTKTDAVAFLKSQGINAVLPGVTKGEKKTATAPEAPVKTAEQLAAEKAAADAAAAAAKREQKNAKKREARARAKAEKQAGKLVDDGIKMVAGSDVSNPAGDAITC
jgi:FKBP-type peptidyl-prolyl cis-trans isomerase